MTEKVVAHHTFFIPLRYFKKSENSPENELIISSFFTSSALWLLLICSTRSWRCQGSNLGLCSQVTFLLHIHTRFAVTHSPVLPFCSVNPAGDTAEIPECPYQGDKSHMSQLPEQTPCFPPSIISGIVPQSLPYQENKQNQHNNLFVFLILPFFSELSLISSFFFTTNLCSLSSKHPQTWLNFSSSLPCARISTWVTFLIHNVK